MKDLLRFWLYDFFMEIILGFEMVWLIITLIVCCSLFDYKGVGKLFARVIGVVIIVSTFCLAYIIPGWIGDKMTMEISRWVKLGYMIMPCIYLLIAICSFKGNDK